MYGIDTLINFVGFYTSVGLVLATAYGVYRAVRTDRQGFNLTVFSTNTLAWPYVLYVAIAATRKSG